MATTATPPTANNQIHFEKHLASFEMIKLHTYDQSKHPGRYWAFVSFGTDSTTHEEKMAIFHLKSSSLENCFEMIEIFGQQCKNMNYKNFDQFIRSKQGKDILFSIEENPKTHEDEIKAHQYHRLGPPTKIDAFAQKTHQISYQARLYLQKYAAHHTAQTNPHHDHRRTFRLKKK